MLLLRSSAFLSSLIFITSSVFSQAYAGNLSRDYFELHAGDFDADGRADIFYQSKRPENEHGVILDTSGSGLFEYTTQTWFNGHLGISWDANTYQAHTSTFNTDARDDVFLQARSVGQTSYVVTATTSIGTDKGSLNSILDAVEDGRYGLKWSTQESVIQPGVGNGNWVFVQSKSLTGKFGIVNSDGAGLSSLRQEWTENHLGLEWSDAAHAAHVGDFNGDGFDDIYLQGKYRFIIMPFDDISIPIRIDPKTDHAIVFADSTGAFMASSTITTWDNSSLGLNDAWMAKTVMS